LQRIELAPSERIAPETDAIVWLAVAACENAVDTLQPASSLERGDDGWLRTAGLETVAAQVVAMDPF
jgi:hypothetical protein